MVAVNDVPQLVDKKGGSCAAIAPKLEAKSTESLSQTYTRYKTLLNELANDGVNLSKHEINVGFVNSLPEKWLTFSQGLRNTNHTQTLDLADIYGRFVFQENSDDEVDERYSEEYLRDLDIEYQERALLENSKCFIKRRNNFSGQKANENTECYKCGNKGHFTRDCFSKTSEPSYKSPVNYYSSVSKGFQPKFTPKLIQSSSNSIRQADTKFQKDCKAEYKKMKAKLALLEVSDEEEVTQVKVLMALADDELTVRKNHARNGSFTKLKGNVIDLSTLLSKRETRLRILYCMICKREDHRTSDHEMYIASLKRSENYKAQPYQYAPSSKKILKAKAKPFPPCTHCGFNDHRPDNCRNYPECEISKSSPSNESSIGIKCNTCGSTVHSITDHNEFDHFKRGEKIQAAKAKEPTKKSNDWFKSLSHKYVKQPGPKVYFLKKKSQAAEMIMSFVKMVENQNDVNVKQIRTNNGTKFRNTKLESFCDEKGISQNFSSPYTPKQNGVDEKKNITLIEDARTMLNSSVLSKHFWTEAVRVTCYN
ncbi:retrovirus-related pol polyprotein from transposon TNT 1-94 [Tanacetum coccineum]